MNPDGGNSALSDLKFDLLGIRRVMDEYRMFAVNEPCIPVQTDVRALLERAVRQYRCIRDGAEIDLVMPEAPLHWNIDAERMAEVICQLLDNGLAFSDHLTVAAQKYARVLKIVVTDQGPGVESYLKERIFEPFFSSRSGGSGLGLAIVRQIVENHGGSIVECGQPEQGACFMIELPETKEKQP
jgi:signal transduction histidine kinase